MKYIRTKNHWFKEDYLGDEIVVEVYQIYSVEKGDDINLWGFDFEGFPRTITEEKIIKAADTIEELCDMFVNTWENSKPSIWEKLENAIDEKNSVRFDIHKKLFGAIWTDKGLIYVTKPIENGKELELL